MQFNAEIVPILEYLKRRLYNSNEYEVVIDLEKLLKKIFSLVLESIVKRYPGLTNRETQIVSLILLGKSSKEIATILTIIKYPILFLKNIFGGESTGDENLLLTPIKLGNRTLENRFALNAMECNDADEYGNPTKRTYERYSRYFEENAGLIDLEAITVTYESRGRLMQLSVEPHNQKALTAFVKEMKRINDKPLFVWQITNSGELRDPTFSRRVTVKPLQGYKNANLLSEEEVDGIIDKFVLGAKIAHDGGADGLDIKLCYGYLATQILRPYIEK